MKAILVDDERSNLDNISSLLHKYCPRVQILATAIDLREAEQAIKLHQPDLVFLDIQMGEQSGFDLLNLIPDKEFEVVFITAFDRYGIEAIKFAALDYLLKPVDIAELVLAVNKAEDKLAKKDKNLQLQLLLDHIKSNERMPSTIALPQLHEIRYVPVMDIIRCESDNSYTFFNLVGGERILISRSIKEYSEMLKPLGFLRAHQSHLVNKTFVKSWLKEDGGCLLLTNGDKVPVSRPNRNALQKALG
ncbi:MAG: response regulator transcription factor [Sphingobacteriales bacterium]|nr:MAG: response regulator transcription factor [Sphingobacteriales bacterium]